MLNKNGTPTGYAANIDSYIDTRTPSQKLSDEIKAKYHKMQEERKKKYPVFRKSNASQSNSSGNGRWVTINWNHVYIS